MADEQSSEFLSQKFRELAHAYQTSDIPAMLEISQAMLSVDPEHLGALHISGNAFLRSGELSKALQRLRKCVNLKPTYALALKDLGEVLLASDSVEEAREVLERSHHCDPRNPNTLVTLASALTRLDQPEEAARVARQALAREPQGAEAHFALAIALLIQQRYREAWEHYEWRWNMSLFPSKTPKGIAPTWNEEDLRGRTLLLYTEQGYGDTIQFLRFVKLLKEAHDTNVVLRCPKSLVSLLRSFAPGKVVGQHCPLPAHDFSLPLLSLPHRLQIEPDNVGIALPYLRPPTEKLLAWRKRLGHLQRFRVGLVWTTGLVKPEKYAASNADKQRRSLSPEQLLPLFELKEVDWVSLQIPPIRDSLPLPMKDRLFSIGDWCEDFADTAAAMRQLDLILTIDTATAHLGGAMGLPVWVLLNTPANWRWSGPEKTSPWYPTIRLVRQTAQGEWSDVITKIRDDLAAILAE
ncbi:MAG: tetratricopeptide repeat protein [Gemmataceae bacterium]